MKKLLIEISNDAFEFLKELEGKVYVEYRDSRYSTIEDFLKSDEYINGGLTLTQFKSRNENGTLHLIHELMEYNLVTDYEDAWHLSYTISKTGKKLLKLNK